MNGAGAVLALLFCLFATLVLVRAAWFKLHHVAGFALVLAQYRILPNAVVGVVARGLLCVELGLGALLLVPAMRGLATPAAALLFLIFAGAVGINLARGRTWIDCGCGDPTTRQTISRRLMLRNLVLMAMMLGVWALPGGWPGVAGAALAAAGAVVLWLLFMALEVLERVPVSLGRRSSRRVRFAPYHSK